MVGVPPCLVPRYTVHELLYFKSSFFFKVRSLRYVIFWPLSKFSYPPLTLSQPRHFQVCFFVFWGSRLSKRQNVKGNDFLTDSGRN